MSLPAEALPGLALTFMIGLRHGLAPDHLAAIDGLTVRAACGRPRWAPWMGAMFALGHALAVMLIVLAAASAPGQSWHPAPDTVAALEWLPALLLLALAARSAYVLLRPAGQPSAPPRWLPRWATLSAGPWTAAGAGALFAFSLESALQALAWGYAGAMLGGVGAALGVAAAFTGGMAVTDTLDGWITARLARSGQPGAVAAFRRRIGWPVVALCVLTAGHLLIGKWCGDCRLGEDNYLLLGGVLLALMACAYGGAMLSARRAPQGSA